MDAGRAFPTRTTATAMAIAIAPFCPFASLAMSPLTLPLIDKPSTWDSKQTTRTL